MVLNTAGGRDEILTRLRDPGPETDKLISALLGLEEKAWTRNYELAESLVPMGAIYTLSHNDDRSFYWCDVSDGFHNVQGWGRTPACALAAAGVAYLMETREALTGYSTSHGEFPESLH
ncbi:MAG: hypothetical protein WB783_09800 [Arenicellales bacterium]|jgi:hypothetical protein